VLINITGGLDLAIDEVTTISSIIQEAAGDDAEIIFGAVHDSSLKEEVRVTVIATGFDRMGQVGERRSNVIQADFAARKVAGMENRGMLRSTPAPSAHTPPAPSGSANPGPPAQATPIRQVQARPVERKLPNDLEIPTFIRRQMD
jgi:cell division protein FtsZ